MCLPASEPADDDGHANYTTFTNKFSDPSRIENAKIITIQNLFRQTYFCYCPLMYVCVRAVRTQPAYGTTTTYS